MAELFLLASPILVLLSGAGALFYLHVQERSFSYKLAVFVGCLALAVYAGRITVAALT